MKLSFTALTEYYVKMRTKYYACYIITARSWQTLQLGSPWNTCGTLCSCDSCKSDREIIYVMKRKKWVLYILLKTYQIMFVAAIAGNKTKINIKLLTKNCKLNFASLCSTCMYIICWQENVVYLLTTFIYRTK